MSRVITSDGTRVGTRWVAGLALAVFFHAALLAVAFKWGPFAPTDGAQSTELSDVPVAPPPSTVAPPVVAESPQITLNLALPSAPGPRAQLATRTVSLATSHRRFTIRKAVAVARSRNAKAQRLRRHAPTKTKRSKVPRHHRRPHHHQQPGVTPSHSVMEWSPAPPPATPSADHRVLI